MERELYVKYIVMGIAKCPIKHTLIEKLWIKYRKEGYYQRLLEKASCKEEPITVIGKHGLRVELPFDQAQIQELPKNYVETYIRKILERYGIEGCYLCRELSFLNGRFDMEKRWLLQYLMFPEGIKMFMEKVGISNKDARFVVIDGGNKKVETILQVLLEYANYLTIVTSRMEYFKNAVDIIYEETGLMIDMVSLDTQKNIYGNVVINLDKDCNRLYSNFEENAYVVDLHFTDQKLEYLANRRNDLTILYDYDISVGGQCYNQELLVEIMVRDNWKASRFVKRDECSLTASEIEFMVKDYDMQIERLKIIRKQHSFLKDIDTRNV
ncbi:MAG: hypothetical protein IKL07_07260 [Clostridium sp.]|nr:hypothetical protein [Clostridium sp.]